MNPVRSTQRRWLTAGGLACAVLLSPGHPGVLAAEPPWTPGQAAISAREQPIGAFLQNLFRQAGMTVVVSPNLRGAVNGAWNAPVSKIYEDVARAFDLLTYYDGSTVYVYAASELATRTVPISSSEAERVRRTARQLGLTDRQNQIRYADGALVATGARRFVDQVDELARTAEAPAPPRGFAMGRDLAPYPVAAPMEYRVFYLRYAWAEDVSFGAGGRTVTVPGVASMLRSLMSGDDGAAPPIARRRETVLPPTVPGLRGQGLRGGYPAETLGYDPASGAEGRVQPASDAVPPAGGIRVQADGRLNAVIVRDTRERMAAYEQLIRALDVEPQLLEIEATIIDVDTRRLRDLGINFRITDSKGGNALLFGSGVFEEDDRLRPDRDVTPSARGFALSTVIGDRAAFTARLRALEVEGALKIVSRPQVLTLSNVEAQFDNSQTFYVRLAGERDVDLFNVTAGTNLRVTPHVMRDRQETRIRLLVAIEDGGITDQNVDDLPIVERSSINTQALIVEGQSLLLGGMTRRTERSDRDKAPVLGDVPLIGNLFRSSSRSASHMERLFLITPRLASISGVPAPGVDAPLPIPPPLPPAPAPTPPASAPLPAPPLAAKG